MLLFSTWKLRYPESTLQPCPSRRFCEVWKQVYFGSLLAIRTTWYSIRTLINQQHPSRRKDPFLLDIHQCLEAHQSSRRSQCSSASAWMTWLYHSDAIQGLTSIRVSASRHSYGKTSRPDDVFYKARCAPVQPSGHQSLGSRRSKPYYGNYVQPRCCKQGFHYSE
jgi:hypothetical protein